MFEQAGSKSCVRVCVRRSASSIEKPPGAKLVLENETWEKSLTRRSYYLRGKTLGYIPFLRNLPLGLHTRGNAWNYALAAAGHRRFTSRYPGDYNRGS